MEKQVVLKNQMLVPKKLDLRIRIFKETGDARIFAGLVDDNVAPMVAEIMSSGIVSDDKILFVSQKNEPLGLDDDLGKIIINSVYQRFLEVQSIYQERGINIVFDEKMLENISPNLDLTASGLLVENRIFNSANSGDVIFGFVSDGQAVWENSPRSGLESCGIDIAEKYLLSNKYNENFQGRFSLLNRPSGLRGMNIGESLSSPTRHYGLLIKDLIQSLKKTGSLDDLHSIILNTNHGATRIAYSKIDNIYGGLRFFEDIRRLKVPPVFNLIQKESMLDWEEMFKTYSCGIGIKVVGKRGGKIIQAIREVEKSSGVKAYRIGEVVRNGNNEGHGLTLNTSHKTITFN